MDRCRVLAAAPGGVISHFPATRLSLPQPSNRFSAPCTRPGQSLGAISSKPVSPKEGTAEHHIRLELTQEPKAFGQLFAILFIVVPGDEAGVPFALPAMVKAQPARLRAF